MILFAQTLLEEILLPLPHRFWTFSIPKAIRGILFRDRRLLKLIPRNAYKAVKMALQADPLDFLARVLMHVPEKNKRRLTYYGIYSSRARGERKKKIHALGEDAQESHPLFNEPCTDPDAFAKKPRQAWAALIKNVWEIDPLGCPRCGAQMKVVAFITDPCVIDKILKHLDKKNRGPREEGAAA